MTRTRPTRLLTVPPPAPKAVYPVVFRTRPNLPERVMVRLVRTRWAETPR